MIADLPQGYCDVACVRFGMMYFQSPVRAMRNIHGALKPGGKLCMIVWRSLADNPCWHTAKEVALEYLPLPGDEAVTCGPGPCSRAGEETDRAMMQAGGFLAPTSNRSTSISASAETSRKPSTINSWYAPRRTHP